MLGAVPLHKHSYLPGMPLGGQQVNNPSEIF